MPLPLTRPNAPYRRSNMPAIFFKLWQDFLNCFPYLHIPIRSSHNSFNKFPKLLVDVIAIACESRKRLTLTVAIGSCLLCPSLQLSDIRENAQGRPYF